MKITGYRTLTEKERDYLTIHRLLRKYEIQTTSIGDDLLNELCGLPLGLVNSSLAHLMPFCLADTDSPNYTIVLDHLPENTVKLLIETK